MQSKLPHILSEWVLEGKNEGLSIMRSLFAWRQEPKWAHYKYSGDLNSEHLNSRNIWITNFHLLAIQMPDNSSLFKPWPEYQTKSLLFKPSVTQPISQTPYDLNSKLLVCYSSHVLNKELLVRYSSHDLNNKPFKEQTVLDHSNTEIVCYSDPHCIYKMAAI